MKSSSKVLISPPNSLIIVFPIRQIDGKDKTLKLFLNTPVSQFQNIIAIQGNFTIGDVIDQSM